MVKAIIKFFRDIWEKDVDYTFEIEFSIYDLFFGAMILGVLIWLILK
jgi:hypothetical protein